MNQNKLAFESENLVVDYISFNIMGSANTELIAKYLFEQLHFNSTFAKGHNGTARSWFYLPKNQHQVSFRQLEHDPASKSFWEGTIMHFSGNNAAQFYKIIQAQKFDWNILKSKYFSLGRIDLYYLRESQLTDQESPLERFFSNTISKPVNQHKKTSLNYDPAIKGYILRIGNRKSSNFYRIYQTKNGLKFELEVKKKSVKQFENLLLSYKIQRFEEIFTEYFYKYSKKVLALNDCYTDWLIKYSRKYYKPIDSFVTSYLKKKETDDLSENVRKFTLLQLLTFCRTKYYDQIQIYDQIYCLIKFSLKEYIQFSGVETINQYQRNKFIKLFYSLQQIEPLVTYFDDQHFQSIMGFPYINIQKQNNHWFVEVAISESLYSYCYPFSFPNTFLIYKDIYDLRIKLEIIESISTVPLEKVFYTEIFLQQFNLSTQKKAQIKNSIVFRFNELEMSNIVENRYVVIKKSGKIEQVDTLTSLLVGQANKIYFYENL